MSKRYKNKTHRALNDMNWDWDDDGYDYAGPRKLRRNKVDGILGGVCAGFGDYVGIDHTIMRFIFIALVIFTGIPLLVYPIFWIFIPKDSRATFRREYRERRKAKKERPEAPRPTANVRDVQSKYRSLDVRLADLEKSVTSGEWKLRREFRDLES